MRYYCDICLIDIKKKSEHIKLILNLDLIKNLKI